MKKIPILIISLALLLFLAPLVFADEITGTLGGNGFVSGITGGVPNDPVASPASGHSASSAFSVSLTAADSTSIRYTTNGSSPSCPSTGTLYSGAITVNASQTIKAIACYGSTNSVPSNVVSFSYTISSNSGSHSSGGGGSYVVPCTSVNYGPWQTCNGSIQVRSVLSQSPSGCSLTTAQQLATTQSCTLTVAPIVAPVSTSTPSVPVITAPVSNVLTDIASEAIILNTWDKGQLLNHLGKTADSTQERAGLIQYRTILGLDKKLTADEKSTVNDFIVYGTRTTQRLGAGERAGAINSYYQAYGKLPDSEAEWSDALKIASGRWPSERSATAEAQAKLEFKKVYLRNAVMTNNIDENAIMVIAYGLLPLNRNLNSERVAIVTFRHVYGHNPVNALAWNIVRAIAYSGATR